jgi:hypothetical protein
VTLDPFLRLAFIALCTAYLTGMVLLAQWLGWPVAMLVGVTGVFLAVVVAQDWTPAPPEQSPERRPRRVDADGHPAEFELVN